MPLPEPTTRVSPFDVILSQTENEDRANLEALAAGVGLDNQSITPDKLSGSHYQTDNNNVISNTLNAPLIRQYGWGQVTGTNGQLLGDAITFPSSFSTILGVNVSYLAARTSVASDITQLNVAFNTTEFTIAASNILNSGFSVNMRRATGTFAAGTFYGYSWEAWGL